MGVFEMFLGGGTLRFGDQSGQHGRKEAGGRGLAAKL